MTPRDATFADDTSADLVWPCARRRGQPHISTTGATRVARLDEDARAHGLQPDAASLDVLYVQSPRGEVALNLLLSMALDDFCPKAGAGDAADMVVNVEPLGANAIEAS